VFVLGLMGMAFSPVLLALLGGDPTGVGFSFGGSLVLWLLLTPILVRVLLAPPPRGGEARRTPLEWAGAVVLVLALAALLAISSVVAFVAICFPIGLASFGWDSGLGIVLAFVLGGLVGLAVLCGRGDWLVGWVMGWPPGRRG
jgi:hypothetical protein